MNKLYTIIIPCHNNCERAEELAKKFDNVIVGHNNCDNRKSLPWANKAKTINQIAKNIKTEYIVVMDADVKVSDFALMAFEREMKKGVKYGVSLLVDINDKDEPVQMQNHPACNGALWCIKTSLLKKYKIPENIVVEDTAYYHLLEKEKIKPKIIVDAVCSTRVYKESLKATLRQGLRYQLGALELMKMRVFNYAVLVFLNLFVSLLICYIAFDIFGYYVILVPFIVYILYHLLRVMTKKKIIKITKTDEFKYIVLAISHMMILPIIALFYFLRRKTIW